MADVANQAPPTDEEIPDLTLSPWREKLDSTLVQQGRPLSPVVERLAGSLDEKKRTSEEALEAELRSYSPLSEFWSLLEPGSSGIATRNSLFDAAADICGACVSRSAAWLQVWDGCDRHCPEKDPDDQDHGIAACGSRPGLANAAEGHQPEDAGRSGRTGADRGARRVSEAAVPTDDARLFDCRTRPKAARGTAELTSVGFEIVPAAADP